MRRSLLPRLLALSLAVAALAAAATVLAAYGAGNHVTERLENDAFLLETDASLHGELLGYAADHPDWEGVGPLVRELAERTGRRIALTTPEGEVIADSARLLGQGAAGLPGTPAARVDAADPDAGPGQRHPRPPHETVTGASGSVPRARLAYDGWRATDAERQRQERLAAEASACLEREGVPAAAPGRPVTAAASLLFPSLTSTAARLEAVWPALDGVAGRCVPPGLTEPTDAVRKLNARAVELVTGCLASHGLPYEVAQGPHGLTAVTPAAGARPPAAWQGCERAAHTAALRPYVAPPADLYLGTPDPADPFSPATWRWLAVTWAGVLLAAAVAAVAGGRRVVRPVRALTAAVRRMESGDLSARVRVRGRDEMTRLGEAFNAMAASVEAGARQRKAMLSDIAHELRTPLANIRSHLEAAEDGVVPVDAALVGSLREESGLLEHLVADLRDLALADAGELRIHPDELDAADLAAQAVAGHSARARASGVALRLDVPPDPVPVFADPVRLRQALSNLVANAVTHTPRGGTVEVRVREGSGGGDGGSSGAVFTVADTGPGIPPEHLPFVFDRCYRADRSRGRAAGGSGLGLAITRRLAEAHGGRVTAQSPPGSGAVFTLRLPPPPPCPAS